MDLPILACLILIHSAAHHLPAGLPTSPELDDERCTQWSKCLQTSFWAGRGACRPVSLPRPISHAPIGRSSIFSRVIGGTRRARPGLTTQEFGEIRAQIRALFPVLMLLFGRHAPSCSQALRGCVCQAHRPTDPRPLVLSNLEAITWFVLDIPVQSAQWPHYLRWAWHWFAE